MPFYSFEATDTQGRRRQGQIQGTTPDQVRQLLDGQGLNNVKIRVAQAAAVTATPVAASAPVVVTALPVVKAQVEMATTKMPDKDRMFFFGQLGRFYHAGIAPNRGLEELAGRANKPHRQETFTAMAQRVGSGTSLADTMREFPRYFGLSDAATIQAGEASGEMTAACDLLANQAEKSFKLKRMMRWYTIILCCFAALFPILKGIVNGSLVSMKVQDEAGGSLPAGPTAMKYAGEGIVTMLPTLVIGVALFFGLRWVWSQDRFLLLRHKLVLMIPLVSGRASSESLVRLAWALQNLAKAGLAPKTSFEIAADSLPNRELARRAREVATGMRENEPLSHALQRAGLFAPELNSVVATGEMTGDVPRAMEQIAAAQHGEFEARDTSFGHLSKFLLYIPLTIMVLVMLATLYLTLYQGIFKQLTPD